MNDPSFRRGLKRLPAHNLTFEAWIYHPQIKTLTEVARECPDVKIVLNHFGGPLGVAPYRRNEVFPGWRADIKALSDCPNMYVKLGGLAMIVNAFDFHLAPLPPSSGEMASAWQPKAAGNICTEELVLLCEEMGINTGVDLDALIEVGRMAEEIVRHQLPGELNHAGSLDAFRRRAAP
jgi:hypothetical protein